MTRRATEEAFFVEHDLQMPSSKDRKVAQRLIHYVREGNSPYRDIQEKEAPEDRLQILRTAQSQWIGKRARRIVDGDGRLGERVKVRYLSARTRDQMRADIYRNTKLKAKGLAVYHPEPFKAIVNDQGKSVGLECLALMDDG